MSEFKNHNELPKEVKEYLENSFKIRVEKLKEDLGNYLNTLTEEEKNKAVDEIYNWNITK